MTQAGRSDQASDIVTADGGGGGGGGGGGVGSERGDISDLVPRYHKSRKRKRRRSSRFPDNDSFHNRYSFFCVSRNSLMPAIYPKSGKQKLLRQEVCNNVICHRRLRPNSDNIILLLPYL